jgi:hypothetical protein
MILNGFTGAATRLIEYGNGSEPPFLLPEGDGR